MLQAPHPTPSVVSQFNGTQNDDVIQISGSQILDAFDFRSRHHIPLNAANGDTIFVNLAAGDDLLFFRMENIASGPQIHLDGGTGTDSLTVSDNGSFRVAAALGGAVIEKTVAGIVTTAAVTSFENLDLTIANRGATITLDDLGGVGVQQVKLHGTDTVQDGFVLNGTATADNVTGSISAADQSLHFINSATGFDVSLPGLSVANNISYQLGDGDDRLNLTASLPAGSKFAVDGGAGSDSLVLTQDGSSVVVTASAGATRIASTLNNIATTITASSVESLDLTISRSGTISIDDLSGVGVAQARLHAVGNTQDNFAINATAAADDVVVSVSAADQSLHATNNTTGFDVSLPGLRTSDALAYNLGAGDDKLSFAQRDLKVAANFVIDGGTGSDFAAITADRDFTLSGSGGNAVFSSTNTPSDPAVRFANFETIDVSLGTAKANIQSLAGTGVSLVKLHATTADDVVQLTNVGTNIFVDGGAGNDTLAIKANLAVALSSDGILAHLQPTGGTDIAAANFETADVTVTVGGAHSIGDLSGTGISHVKLRLEGRTDDVDTVTIHATEGADDFIATTQASDGGEHFTSRATGYDVSIIDSSTLDQVIFDMGAGDDRLTASIFPGQKVTVKGGAGNDTYVLDGFAAPTAGNFKIADFTAHNGTGMGDLIAMTRYADKSFADLIAHNHLVQVGADVQLLNGFNVVLTLQNIQLSSLSAADFLFT